MKKIVIVGGGFAGLNAAKQLGRCKNVEVLLIDRRNHHLFQPLLYQVATAGLSPADIAAPIRSILSNYRNIRVVQGIVRDADLNANLVQTDFGDVEFDYLILACGATHSYFGKPEWEANAPGLKSIENATEIRRRVLTAFEEAERSQDPETQRKQLTFVVVGGGPTGVEMAGAIGEMSRFTLARDFKSINAKSTRVFLMEGGPRILPAFDKKLSDRAARDLEKLGVQIWTSSLVTELNADGVTVGDERIAAATVIWAAGVKASEIGAKLGLDVDRAGKIKVQNDLSVPEFPHVFVAGDLACLEDDNGVPLPGVAPVAVQQGRFIGKAICQEVARGDQPAEPRSAFRYVDKGIMATVGRNKAVLQSGRWQMTGRLAWFAWLVVHVYFLTGFKNRFFVVLNWAWSYLTYGRGARLIVGSKEEQRTRNSVD